MRKEQTIFLVLITIILYLLYLIIDYKYKEYKINNHIEVIEHNNTKMTQEIVSYKQNLDYINTKAYKNKVLKEEQSMKNKGEKVIFITNEEKYNTFSLQTTGEETPILQVEKKIQDSMDIYEKWIYFLFKKDIR